MITLPTHCTSCETELVYDGTNLWCHNKSCPAQSIGVTSNFFKVLDIKGFGPATCEKLGHVLDILSLSEEEFIEKIGAANGTKLFNLVCSAKNTAHSAAKLLAAMSIPSVGSNTSLKLAVCVRDGTLDISEESLIAAGITPATRNKILKWYTSDYETIWGGVLPLTVISDGDKAIRLSIGPTVCVTGKIDGYTRDSIAAYLSDKYGCKVVSTVSSKLDYLICNTQSNSSSFTKAQSLGIPILTLNQFEEKLND